MSIPRPCDVGCRAIDLDCCLFPFLTRDSAITPGSLPPLYCILIFPFLPLFYLWLLWLSQLYYFFRSAPDEEVCLCTSASWALLRAHGLAAPPLHDLVTFSLLEWHFVKPCIPSRFYLLLLGRRCYLSGECGCVCLGNADSRYVKSILNLCIDKYLDKSHKLKNFNFF